MNSEKILKRKIFSQSKVGVFSVGHDEYWDQFPGLKDKLIKHYDYFVQKLKENTTTTIIKNEGICDNNQEAFATGDFFAKKDLNLIMCFLSTYTPSGNVLPVLRKLDIPIILVALQPEKAMDYENATTAIQLENDNLTSLPEISNSLIRSNKKMEDCVVGHLYDDEEAWENLYSWCQIAEVLSALQNSTLGYLGHVYEGMLDMNTDPTMFTGHWGMHIKYLEMEDLKKQISLVSAKEKENKLDKINKIFQFPDPQKDPLTSKVKQEDLEGPAKVACGMDKLVTNLDLDGLAYYYKGQEGNENARIQAAMIIGNSFLTTRGIPVAGEADLKNCVAMLIMERLEAGGSFCELHPADFKENFVLVGHDGPHHLGIAEGKPVLRNLELYHGKKGHGPSVEYKLKAGPITILGLTQTFTGQFKMVVAEGESLAGPIPATGNTNTRGFFKPDLKTFLKNWSWEGPTHHFALGTGHIAHKLEKLAQCLDMECKVVTPKNTKQEL